MFLPYACFYLGNYSLYHKEEGYFSLQNGPLMLALSVVYVRRGSFRASHSGDVVAPSGSNSL